MATLKDQMAADLDSVFFNTDEFAETVLYTASGEFPVSVSAIVDRAGQHLEPYIRGQRTAVIEVTVKTSDVPDIARGDTFEIDDKTWEVDPGEGVIYKDDYVTRIMLEREMS